MGKAQDWGGGQRSGYGSGSAVLGKQWTQQICHVEGDRRLVDGAQKQVLPTNLGVWKLELWQIDGG